MPSEKTAPMEMQPPIKMIDAATIFLEYYVTEKKDNGVIDEEVDQAREAWLTWTGKAFNAALKRARLIE